MGWRIDCDHLQDDSRDARRRNRRCKLRSALATAPRSDRAAPYRRVLAAVALAIVIDRRRSRLVDGETREAGGESLCEHARRRHTFPRGLWVVVSMIPRLLSRVRAATLGHGKTEVASGERDVSRARPVSPSIRQHSPSPFPHPELDITSWALRPRGLRPRARAARRERQAGGPAGRRAGGLAGRRCRQRRGDSDGSVDALARRQQWCSCGSARVANDVLRRRAVAAGGAAAAAAVAAAPLTGREGDSVTCGLAPAGAVRLSRASPPNAKCGRGRPCARRHGLGPTLSHAGRTVAIARPLSSRGGTHWHSRR